MKIRFISSFITVLFLSFLLTAQTETLPQHPTGIPPYLYVQNHWVDSLMKSMTDDEKIGQLFMVAVWSNKPDDRDRISSLIQQYHIGGLIFFQGGPVRQAEFTNYFQSITNVPLLIGEDAEWGLSMRLDSTIVFPHEVMLGAIDDNRLVYDFGSEMARECKRIGVNVSFSPVVDINSNPRNPVIGDRSFGEAKNNVVEKGLAYMKGLQDNDVLACAKHFPGHGNTDQDSHKTLPVISASLKQLDSMDLVPFQSLIDSGVGSVMVAHLEIPTLDNTQDLPASLSKKVVVGLLKNEMGFHGLSITDALMMKGITNYYQQPGQADLMALLAGNDILLYSLDIPAAVQAIKTAVDQHLISMDEINMHVRKILQAKYWLGLAHRKPVEINHLVDDLNSPSALLLKRKLIESSLTLVKNDHSLIPIQRPDTLRTACISLGSDSLTSFQKMMMNYMPLDHFSIEKIKNKTAIDSLLVHFKKYNLIILGLQNLSRKVETNYELTDEEIEFIQRLQREKNVVLIAFGNPYVLQFLPGSSTVVEAYNNDDMTQDIAAQLIMGGIAAKGKLSVTAGTYGLNSGLSTQPIRVKYTIPEDAGVSSLALKPIDDLVQQAIAAQATPGCQVWIAKDNKVIWNKSYGNFTYDSNVPVADSDLYDVASVTKIAATTLMAMKLYEQGKLNLHASASQYLPELKNTDKANIKIWQLLTHQSGFKPFIPFYKETIDSSGNLKKNVFSKTAKENYTVQVTPDLFMRNDYADSLWNLIVKTPLENPGHYIYSDNDFHVLKKILEKISGQSLDEFTAEKFYAPLGLDAIGFKPLQKFPVTQMVPSNYDYEWRKEKLQGSVHDQGAAMFGGVAGNAGLFCNANDLGTLMNMLLDNGFYGNKKYFDSATIQLFTRQYDRQCRRGLGFDKPETDPKKASPACKSASTEAFGHQGFTGTCVWADPAQHLVFVFLSNRTFPDDGNKKLGDLETRIKIQQVIYDAIALPYQRNP